MKINSEKNLNILKGRVEMNSMELAISLEMESKKFYLEQADQTEDHGLRSIFHTLAEDESIHARILKNKAAELPFELVDTYAEIKNIFSAIGAHKGIVKIKPESVDLYNMALENEKKSLRLYENMKQEADSDNEKAVFDFLIRQETDHFEVMEELIKLINRPRDWVESAEFGLREEY